METALGQGNVMTERKAQSLKYKTITQMLKLDQWLEASCQYFSSKRVAVNFKIKLLDSLILSRYSLKNI